MGIGVRWFLQGNYEAKIDTDDTDFPPGLSQTEGEDPSFFVGIVGESVEGGVDGFQICLQVKTQCFLEGALLPDNGSFNYSPPPMRTSLNETRILPGQLNVDPFFGNAYQAPGQPYNIDPWNYSGNEGDLFDSQNDPLHANAGYPEETVDWVLVSLRTEIDKSSIVKRAAAILMDDGTIKFIENGEIIDFMPYCGLPSDGYYITIEHRNHLIVMNPDPVTSSNNMIGFDFRQSDSYQGIFGLGVSQLFVDDGLKDKYAMYASNGDQTLLSASTDINVNDKVIWEVGNNRFAEYLPGDYNLSGDVNVNDKSVWQNNNNNFSEVPN